jgi:oligopeptide/dipeptide ABC transporter ATP-binding protein
VSEANSKTVLQVTNLKTYFFVEDGVVKAVDGVDFYVESGEVFGLVGESGCGKTVTSLSIMGLVGEPGKVVEGEILFEGKDLLKLAKDELAKIRGKEISMIFQQPQSSLNPVITVGNQVGEVFEIHTELHKTEIWEKAVEMLRLVGIPSPDKKAYAYPHEMSGGQAQRVMIAMALLLNPKLLIADEPTTALDVTIQAQILDLMLDLKEKMNTAIVLITHDLGVIAEVADRVGVMYAGKIVEQCSVYDLFADPLHPYSMGLINSVPILGEIKQRLEVIPGNVPDLIDLPAGCIFASRCQARIDHQLTQCTEVMPDLIEFKAGHQVRCWLYQKE